MQDRECDEWASNPLEGEGPALGTVQGTSKVVLQRHWSFASTMVEEKTVSV